MKVSETVRKFFSNPSRTNVLSTTTRDGKTNVAMFGSLVLKEEGDDSVLMLMLGDNRTYANLEENRYASCLVIMPGKSGMETEGCRLYLRAKFIEDSGERREKMLEGLRARLGMMADMLKHLVVFEILETRPLIDLGQGI